MKRPAVFLDRDGTIIEDREYLSRPDGVYLIPGAAESLRRLCDAGYACVVITNQSGIGRGMMTEADYERVNAEMLRQLEIHGARLDGVYHCPAAPAISPAEEHPDRKPAPGLILRASRDLNLDVARSWAVGDSLRDLLAGRQAGCRAGILVRTGKPYPASEEELLRDWLLAIDFAAATALILAQPHFGSGG